MLLSMETCTLRKRFGDLRALEMLKEAGFEGADYSFYWTDAHDEMLGDDYAEKARALRARLDELGLVCRQGHAPFVFAYGDEMSAENEHWLGIARSIEFAGILGIRHLVIHSITVPEGVDFWEYNTAFYRSFLPLLEKAHVLCSVENLFDHDRKRDAYTAKCTDPDRLNAMVRSLGANYDICIDIGHAALAGWEPEDYIRRIDPELLGCLHVQDTTYRADSHTVPGLGLVNWPEAMRALRETGYRGDCNLEVFGWMNGVRDERFMPAALRFAEEAGRILIALYEN